MDKKCFIVSPIGPEGSDIRIRSDNLLNYLLKPICDSNYITPVRADEITTTSIITEDIYKHLDEDDLVIVDITTLNPNVFLELGYRIAKKKPYIIIKDKDVQEKYPFDISGIRIMEYSLKLENLESSKELLNKFLQNVNYSTNYENEIIPATENHSGMKFVSRENGNISLCIIPPKK